MSDLFFRSTRYAGSGPYVTYPDGKTRLKTMQQMREEIIAYEQDRAERAAYEAACKAAAAKQAAKVAEAAAATAAAALTAASTAAAAAAAQERSALPPICESPSSAALGPPKRSMSMSAFGSPKAAEQRPSTPTAPEAASAKSVSHRTPSKTSSFTAGLFGGLFGRKHSHVPAPAASAAAAAEATPLARTPSASGTMMMPLGGVTSPRSRAGAATDAPLLAQMPGMPLSQGAKADRAAEVAAAAVPSEPFSAGAPSRMRQLNGSSAVSTPEKPLPDRVAAGGAPVAPGSGGARPNLPRLAIHPDLPSPDVTPRALTLEVPHFVDSPQRGTDSPVKRFFDSTIATIKDGFSALGGAGPGQKMEIEPPTRSYMRKEGLVQDGESVRGDGKVEPLFWGGGSAASAPFTTRSPHRKGARGERVTLPREKLVFNCVNVFNCMPMMYRMHYLVLL